MWSPCRSRAYNVHVPHMVLAVHYACVHVCVTGVSLCSLCENMEVGHRGRNSFCKNGETDNEISFTHSQERILESR